MKYNDLDVPKTINTNRIISAFSNDMDAGKLEHYTSIMKAEMLSHDFPPILGFPLIISECEIGEAFLTGEDITENHFGQLAWKVTDGHHRSISAIEAGLAYLPVKLDYSCITNEEDRKQFN